MYVLVAKMALKQTDILHFANGMVGGCLEGGSIMYVCIYMYIYIYIYIYYSLRVKRKQVSSFLMSFPSVLLACWCIICQETGFMVAQIVSRWTQEAACVNSTGRSAAYTHLLSASSSSSVPTCTLCVPGMQMKSLDAIRVKSIRLKSRGNRTELFSSVNAAPKVQPVLFYFIVYHLHMFQTERYCQEVPFCVTKRNSGITWHSYCPFFRMLIVLCYI